MGAGLWIELSIAGNLGLLRPAFRLVHVMSTVEVIPSAFPISPTVTARFEVSLMDGCSSGWFALGRAGRFDFFHFEGELASHPILGFGQVAGRRVDAD